MVSDMNIFVWKLSKIAAQKKVFFSLSLFSLLTYRLTVFSLPLPEVGCPIFLEIRNSWGKVMERNGLRYEHFCLQIVENCRAKKSFFFSLFSLLRYRLMVFLPPLPEVGCPIFFRYSESLGKSIGKKWLSDMKIFVWKLSKIAAQKKVFFSLFFHFWGTV